MKSLGELLRELRGNASLREASERIGISHNYLRNLEKGIDPRTKTPINPSAETLKKIAKAYDYPYEELLKVAGYLDDNDKPKLPELTEKDERDIQKELEKIINGLKTGSGFAAFGGVDIDELDEEDRELLIASLENSLRLAKRIAKQKFTPKKYRKE
ncbi:helix-turn-helix transcriptional regulator [Geobacillus stearothermophilus]|uniref:Immunity repressor protein n=1 Tax=Bacillus phage 1 TaxID=2785079 RepID=A6XML9_9CAUD|nr:helix-turn-helix transcriptional regulator [Geobacillus stearothermophilus]YP_001425626.1 immunity repressor protein [Bacillus phage 1]ABJ09642.1 immunity repressor protein [Bacillus phage 1]KMY60138.1 XRE family transcriptional regulator [Geobacillus stearothermophilus]MED4830696.1 helix-turn-helix transcriptional regulator [Geobacillus stearothermophilus]